MTERSIGEKVDKPPVLEELIHGLELPLTAIESLETILAELTVINQPFRSIFYQILRDHRHVLLSAPGSRRNHQAWRGGYIGHVAECFRLAKYLIEYEKQRERPFSLSDAYIVLFLHDIEKPFAYTFNEKGEVITRPELSQKADKKAFREKFIEEYNIPLTDDHRNGLQYIEGVRDADYKPHDRIMEPLAGLCHAVDTFGARVDHEYPEH